MTQYRRFWSIIQEKNTNSQRCLKMMNLEKNWQQYTLTLVDYILPQNNLLLLLIISPPGGR